MKLTKEQVLKNLEDIVRFGGLTMSSEFVESVRIAMEAYEQEPCEDCISRQAVIDITAETGALETQRRVMTLPPVYPKVKTEWIPIKWHNITEEERERECYPKDWLTILDCQMPNDDEEVLVTVKGKNGNLYVETDTCYFDGTCYSSDNGYDWIDDVIAWMPLPEPYKAESEV